MHCSCMRPVCLNRARKGKQDDGHWRNGVPCLDCLCLNIGERAAEGRTARAESGEGEAAGELGNAALEFLPSAAGRVACLELELNCEKQGIALMPEERSDERQLTQPMPRTLHAVGSND